VCRLWKDGCGSEGHKKDDDATSTTIRAGVAWWWSSRRNEEEEALGGIGSGRHLCGYLLRVSEGGQTKLRRGLGATTKNEEPTTGENFAGRGR
jgi:hypothetical protein